MGGGAIAMAGTGLLASHTAAQGTPEVTSVEMPELLLQWAAGWSTLGDPSILLGAFTDDAIYEDVAAGDVLQGADAVRQLLTEAAAAIPDFTVTLQTGFATAELAAAEYLITGTQTGDLPYLAATGKPFTLRANSIFVLEGGLIRRESRYYDMIQFLTQLGGLTDAALADLGTPAAEPGGGM
jgi:steroid delta-isomerase-like uncharacterized protein